MSGFSYAFEHFASSPEHKQMGAVCGPRSQVARSSCPVLLPTHVNSSYIS